jgi:hypothetical protein
MKNLSYCVHRVLKPVLKSSSNSLLARLILDWELVVGDKFFSLCELETMRWSPVKKKILIGETEKNIKKNQMQRKATLILRSNPAARLAIQHHQQLLIAKVNEYIGMEMIDGVRFSTTSPLYYRLCFNRIASQQKKNEDDYKKDDAHHKNDEKHSELEEVLERIRVLVTHAS